MKIWCLVLLTTAILACGGPDSALGIDCGQTFSGPSVYQPCTFPFTFEGVTHTECTDQGDPGKFWCSTHPEGKGRDDDQWGYCHFRCYRARPRPATTTSSPSSSTTRTRPPTTSTTLPDMLLRSGQDREPSYGGFTTPQTNQPAVETNDEDIDDHTVVLDKTAAGDYMPLAEDVPTTCGYRTDTGFILGGRDTKRGEFPFMALLGYKRSPSSPVKFHCGGTLINRRYVLTAAHCHDKNISQRQVKQVVLGDHKLGQDPDCPRQCAPNQVFKICPKDVTLHPDWDIAKATTQANDIALIRLPKAATTIVQDPTVRVLPACILWNKDIPRPQKVESLVMGWGRRNNNWQFDQGNTSTVGAFSTILQKLEVKVYSGQFCSRNFTTFRYIHQERHICAGGERGKDSCAGDSGGPLIARGGTDAPMYLRGIVSFGTTRCGIGLPGVYTKLDYYIPWIMKNMKP